MKYKIAICDDAQIDREYIARMVSSWASARGVMVELAQYPSAESFWFAFQQESDVDVLLLDIEMGRMDGVTLAKQVRQISEALQIVFITGYSDYIAEGYEVAALHYLMKPVKEEKLFAVLDRAIDRVAKNERMLNLDVSGDMVRVPLYRIRYADVLGNYVTVHAAQDYTVKMTLSELERLLDERFFRVGRSLIVQLAQVARVSRTAVVLSDGTILPLPRGAYEQLNRAIIERT